MGALPTPLTCSNRRAAPPHKKQRLIAAVPFATYALARSRSHESVAVQAPLPRLPLAWKKSGACTLYKRGSDVRVTYTGPGPDASCAEIATKWSASGDYRTRTAAEAFGALVTICSLTCNDIEITVEDSGSQIYGSNICANLTAAGFS